MYYVPFQVTDNFMYLRYIEAQGCVYIIVVQFNRYISAAVRVHRVIDCFHTLQLKATFCLPIIGVKKNPQSPMYTQLGVITKGTVVEVSCDTLDTKNGVQQLQFMSFNSCCLEHKLKSILRELAYTVHTASVSLFQGRITAI